MRMRDAVGTSLLVITVSSLAALVTRAGTVEGLDWAVVGAVRRGRDPRSVGP